MKILQSNHTKLSETFSHKDCEINPSLDKETREKLCKIIEDNKSTFATSKLSVITEK